jgi:hypothetical protein
MTTTRTMLAALAVAGALNAVPATAAATPPAQASGAATIAIIPTSVHEADGNTILDGTAIGTYTGTISATVNSTFHWVIRPNGTFEFRDSGTLTGTVGDCDTLTVPVQGEVTGTLAAYSGRLNTIDESAASTSTHINIAFTGSGFVATYSGTYNCA